MSVWAPRSGRQREAAARRGRGAGGDRRRPHVGAEAGGGGLGGGSAVPRAEQRGGVHAQLGGAVAGGRAQAQRGPLEELPRPAGAGGARPGAGGALPGAELGLRPRRLPGVPQHRQA